MARVVGLGEVMIRLAPPGRQRIEQAHSFDIEIGGAELNTLVGLARLGHDCSLVTRLPDNPLGRLVRNRIREHGVGTEYVKLVDDGRQGLCFFEAGAEPRPSEVFYDRANSAFARIDCFDFDWDVIATMYEILHVSGITLALSESARRTVDIAMRAFKRLYKLNSLDVNYRSKLWSVADAATCFRSFMPMANYLFASRADAETLFGIRDNDFPVKLHCENSMPHVVAYTTRTETGGGLRGTIRGHFVGLKGDSCQSADYSFDLVDRIGAGDAFAAGIIDGCQSGHDDGGVEQATIMAALQHTIPGDLPIMTRDDIESVRANKTTGVRR
jgi:2-dehydro-3-deoxygluconokinase